MMYLLGEIWAYLAGAGLIGFLTGWFLQRSSQKRKINYLERLWKANMASLEMELDSLRNPDEARGDASAVSSPGAEQA